LLRDEVLEDGDLASREEKDGLLSFLAAELPLPRVATEAEPDALLATGAVVGLRDPREIKIKSSSILGSYMEEMWHRLKVVD
jgi:hypothetical protein